MLPESEGKRTALPGALAPGAEVSISVVIVAPAEPGVLSAHLLLFRRR